MQNSFSSLGIYAVGVALLGMAGSPGQAQTSSPAPAADAAKPPNIVFVLTDDMGYSDPNCYGGNFAPTPNIDRLAKEGIRFTHFMTTLRFARRRARLTSPACFRRAGIS